MPISMTKRIYINLDGKEKNEMKEKYQPVEMETIVFDEEAVITTSGLCQYETEEG